LAGASKCSSDLCFPSPFNVNTFHCYTTAGKVGVILSYAASLFSAIFFPFKMRMIYSRRKAKLEAAGIQPTLKHIIFFRTALGRAVSLQPLIAQQDGSLSIQASQFEPLSPNSVAASAGAVDFKAIKTALAQQSQQYQQLSAEMRGSCASNGRLTADLQQEMRASYGRLHVDLQKLLQRELSESNERLHTELSELKQQQLQQQQQQHQAVASLAAQVQLLVSHNA
jgi:hypothetical protein